MFILPLLVCFFIYSLVFHSLNSRFRGEKKSGGENFMRPALKIVILTTVAQPLADRGGRQPPGAFILPFTLT